MERHNEPVSQTSATKGLALRPNETRVLGSRYQIRRLIGRGGMSDVYLGDDLLLERSVAIKIMHQQNLASDPAGLERFRREAMTLAAVKSPHVVGIYDIGIEGDNAFLVMQHLEGLTIEQQIARNGPMTFTRAEVVLNQVLDGLAELHSQGLIHRDIKPSNVLIDNADHVVLLDLGIVLDTKRAPLTATGMVAGTPGYLAPETRFSASCEFASDVYQVGLLMLFLLTGVDCARRTHVTSFEDLVLRLPTPLVNVARRALAIDPAQRYHSAAIMRKAVTVALAEPERKPEYSKTAVTPRAPPAHGPFTLVRNIFDERQRPTTEIAPLRLLTLLSETCPTVPDPEPKPDHEPQVKTTTLPAAQILAQRFVATTRVKTMPLGAQLQLVRLPAPATRGRILIVDEDAAFSVMLQRLLKDAHEISVVKASERAVGMIRSGKRFHVILCGMQRPMKLHTALLAMCPDQAAAIIFLMHGAATKETRTLLATVANKTLGMPFEIELLKEMIDERLAAGGSK